MIRLGEDGTLDTVLVCEECSEEFRYTFDGADETEYLADELTNGKPYRDFIAWAIADATKEHACIEAPLMSHTEVTSDNYFDAAQALYWYCSNHHGGQWSEEYSIMSARLEYRPGACERAPDADTEAPQFYGELVGKGWDPTEMLDAIKTHTGKDE